jgi:hypothetical protein
MMPRVDIKALIARNALLTFEYNGTSTLDGDAVLKIIDAMYDDYETEISQLKDELQNYKDILESPKHIKRKD